MFRATRAVLGLVGLPVLLFALPAWSAVEPLSGAERVAVSMVADYLDGGPSALWPRVANGSWLHGLGQQRGEVELSVRLGPVRGSRWTLARYGGTSNQAAFQVEFASGLDDVVVLEVDAGAGRLVSVSTLAETSLGGQQRGGTPRSMAGLVTLRHLLARGDVLLGGDDQDVESLIRASDAAGGPDTAGGFETTVKLMWLAQYRLLQSDAQGAREALGTVASGGSAGAAGAEAPLHLLLNARIAALEEDGVTAETLYRNLLARFDSDVVEEEFALMLLEAGDWQRAQTELVRLVKNGTRRAEPHFLLSRLQLFSHLGQAEATFRSGWRLQPLERAELLEDPYYSMLVSRAGLSDLLRLNEAAEPISGPAETARKTIDWPQGSRFTLTGEHLLAVVGGAALSLPGGAILAPTSVGATAPGELRLRLDELALASMPRLLARLRDAESLRSPALVREVEEAAEALTRQAERSSTRGREDAWKRLVELTRVVQNAESPPPNLAALRARALWQLRQKQPAIDLLAALARDSQLVDEDPSVLWQLAQLCADEGRPDLAIRLLRRVRNVERFPGLVRQIDRFELDERLGESYSTYETVHFQLRHEKAMPRSEVVILGGYLEIELQRLEDWIPFSSTERIEVHLVPAKDFYRVYGGGVGILGLFDGRIRLPVFEVGKQQLVMAGVLSHELAHAMIDATTHDCAPKWFHEGLAQLVEPGGRQINPYRTGEAPIAMPLLESVLRGFNESRIVGLAYGEAYWTLRFVEREHGRDGIHRLIESFSGCHDTADALHQALKTNPVEFDRSLQAWASGPDAPLEDRVRVAYTQEEIRDVESMAPGLGEAFDEHLEAAPAMPKVGLVEGYKAATKEELEDAFVEEAIKIMVKWHADYDRFASLIKQELATVLRGIRSESMPPHELKGACNNLWTLATSIQMGELETIDKDVTRSLRAAYAAIGKLGSACARGQAIDSSLKVAEKNLAAAAYHLEKYGLKP